MTYEGAHVPVARPVPSQTSVGMEMTSAALAELGIVPRDTGIAVSYDRKAPVRVTAGIFIR